MLKPLTLTHKIMAEEHVRQEDKIRRVLFNEGAFLLGLVGVISSVIFWVSGPQNALKLEIVRLQGQVESNESVAVELSKIKNNDLHEMQLRMDRIEARQIEELQAIARIEALLKLK